MTESSDIRSLVCRGGDLASCPHEVPMSHIKALELLGDDTSSPAARHDAEGGLTAHAHPGVGGGSSTRLAISSCSGTASGSTRSSCLRDKAPYSSPARSSRSSSSANLPHS